MSGRIIPLRGDPHGEVQRLLPWFVTGRLDAADLSLVESHLGQCAACRAEAASERRLRDEVRALPVEIESGWARMQARLGPDRPRRGRLTRLIHRLMSQGRGVVGGASVWMGWAMAGQAAAIVALAVVAVRPTTSPGAYHTLGAAPTASGGDIVVLFRPTSREADIRAALRASHARLADGPTEAGAYVLRVAPEARAVALRRLKMNASVELAEPIDAQAPR
jgi:anti-sigma factor RsiW